MAHVGFPAASRILSRKGCSVERQFEEVISNWISISPRLSRDVQCAGKYPAPGHALNSPTVAVGRMSRNASGKRWPGRCRMKRRTFPRVRPEKQPEHHHNVYVVLFDPAVGRVRKVRAASPKRERKKPCVYVGMTGLAAPSAAATDPWRFVVVKNREMLSRIADALPYGKMIGSAALSIVVCGDLEAAHDKQLSYLLQDCGGHREPAAVCACSWIGGLLAGGPSQGTAREASARNLRAERSGDTGGLHRNWIPG